MVGGDLFGRLGLHQLHHAGTELLLPGQLFHVFTQSAPQGIVLGVGVQEVRPVPHGTGHFLIQRGIDLVFRLFHGVIPVLDPLNAGNGRFQRSRIHAGGIGIKGRGLRPGFCLRLVTGGDVGIGAHFAEILALSQLLAVGQPAGGGNGIDQSAGGGAEHGVGPHGIQNYLGGPQAPDHIAQQGGQQQGSHQHKQHSAEQAPG